MQQNTQTNVNEKKQGLLRKIFFAILILLILFLLLAVISHGFTWNFFAILVLWAIVLFVTYRFIFQRKYSLLVIIPIIILALIISFLVYPSGSTKGTGGIFDSKNSAGLNTGNTNTDFTKKVLKISSPDGNAAGTVSVEKKSANTYYAVYNFLVKTDVPFNAKCGPIGTISQSMCAGTHYEYSGRLLRPDKPDDKRGTGVVSAAYCNKDVNVPDPYSISNRIYSLETCGIKNIEGLKTDTFYTTFSANFNSYDAFLKATKFEMYDFSNFWENGDQPNSYVGNTDRPVTESSPVKTFTLTISE